MNWLKKLFKLFFPGKKTVKIAIFGNRNCGKTELWCQLQGKKNTSSGGTGNERVERFKLGKNSNGDNVFVETTKDFGGSQNWVKDYETLIDCDGVFIYYLISLCEIDDHILDTRYRLRVISSTIKKKKLKNCGIRILGTFYDKYNGSKENAIAEIQNKIFYQKIIDFDISKENIQIICTLTKYDIDDIKNQILKTIKA